MPTNFLPLAALVLCILDILLFLSGIQMRVPIGFAATGGVALLALNSILFPPSNR
jgi:hypothetical protein